MGGILRIVRRGAVIALATVGLALPATPARAVYTDAGLTMIGTFSVSTTVACEAVGLIPWSLHLEFGLHVKGAYGQVLPQQDTTISLDLSGSAFGIIGSAFGTGNGGTYSTGSQTYTLTVDTFTWSGNAVSISGRVNSPDNGQYDVAATLTPVGKCEGSVRSWDAQGEIHFANA